jgi:hypothetical protein
MIYGTGKELETGVVCGKQAKVNRRMVIKHKPKKKMRK